MFIQQDRSFEHEPHFETRDFPIGSLESRAAVTKLLSSRQDTRERLEIVSYIARPRCDNSKPHASPSTETEDGRLIHVLYTPAGLEGEARRIVDELL